MIDHRINAISFKPVRRGTRVAMVGIKGGTIIVERDPKGEFKVLTPIHKRWETRIQVRHM